MVLARVSLTKYSNRVLSVVKARYDLQTKSEALNKFIEEHGEEEVEKEATDNYMKKMLEIEKTHFKKYGYRKMGDKELDKLFGK